MDNKIFLGKYRVSGQEIETVGECAGSPLAYEAQQIATGKKVVVELIPAGGLKTAEREQLEAEANAAKKIKHANIPTLYDFGVEEDYLVYVTEDFGGTLAEEWVNMHGPLPVGPVLRIASQVVRALGTAVLHQIVHQAINPSNLVLVAGQTAEGEWPMVKVLHLGGVAPTLSDTGDTIATFDKSLHYVSPEQIRDGTVDFRSEIYSLGATMWFLLTGTPPLVAPGKSFAVASTAPGGKVSAIPRKVRRLLAQMLSTNPEGRPQDPFEFHRKLQDCLVQVERREAMSHRFGVPSFSRDPADMPGSRRTLTKTLAVAALVLTMAALAALVVHGYLRHRRIVRAEEPIGVPVGVQSSVTTATPAATNETNAIASNTTQTTSTSAQPDSPRSARPQGPNTVTTSTIPVDARAVGSNLEQTTNSTAQSNQPSSVPAETQSTGAAASPAAAATTDAIASNSSQTAGAVAQSSYSPSEQVQSAAADNTKALRGATAATEKAGQNQFTISPAQRPTPNSVPNSQMQPAVAANGTDTATGSSESASTNRASRPSVQSSDADTQQSARKKFATHEVRRAEPVEPTVRRAEPAPPAEGEGETTAPDTTASSERQANSPAQVEKNRDAGAETAEKPSRGEKRTDSEPKVAARRRIKSERRTRPKKWGDERIYPPQPMPESEGAIPRGRFRARFVGVTPDGQWMLLLPSNKIIVVPPPQQGVDPRYR